MTTRSRSFLLGGDGRRKQDRFPAKGAVRAEAGDLRKLGPFGDSSNLELLKCNIDL